MTIIGEIPEIQDHVVRGDTWYWLGLANDARFVLRHLVIQPPELANFSGALTRDVSPFWCRFSSTRVRCPTCSVEWGAQRLVYRIDSPPGTPVSA